MFKIYKITATNTTQEIGIVYKTNIKMVNQNNPILAYGAIGVNIDLNKSDYKSDKFRFRIGTSNDGYLQYSVIECSNRANYHSIIILEILNSN